MKENEENYSRPERGNRTNKANPNWRESENEKFSNLKQTTEISFTSRIQEMEGRISGIEDTVEEMAISVKENVKSKKLLAQTSRKSGTGWKNQI